MKLSRGLKMWIFLAIINILTTRCYGADPLELLNIDPNGISVSGISSGGCMATQFHVGYSANIQGVGVIAGAPYYCARASGLIATTDCTSDPDDVNVSELRAQAERYASRGDIDLTTNMGGDRVWVFAGQSDSVVNPGLSDKVAEFYDSYTSNIHLEKSLNTEHNFPTVNKGNPCLDPSSPFIGRCDYDGAFEMLNYIYGDLVRPDREGITPLPGTFREFDQREFFYLSLPLQSSMDNEGYVYIPAACQAGQLCGLHIALHGCAQGREAVGEVFAQDAGYNEVGELNDMVILYPQAISSGAVPTNPLGCWDWWGYNTWDYANKGGFQMVAIARMVDKIAGTSLDQFHSSST